MERTPPSSPAAGQERWKMRVLVVEDDALTAASLAALLRAAGHAVEVARDGLAARSQLMADFRVPMSCFPADSQYVE